MSNAYQTMGQAPFAMLADVVRGYKQKGAREQQQQELSQILTNPEGGAATREGIMGRMAQSQNPQLQNMALAMMLRQPEQAKNPFGGSFDANAFNIALTGDVNDPQTQAAYQQLKSDKISRNPTTGDVIEIKGFVPEVIERRFSGVFDQPSADMPPQAGAGGEQVSERVKVYKGEGKPATSDESKAMGFANRMIGAEGIYDELIAEGFEPASFSTGVQETFAGSSLTPDLIAQSALSEPVKRYLGSKLDFVTAVLRRESGAAISAAEFETEDKKYFPQVGDGAKTLADKKARRQRALEAMGKSAGKAYERDFPMEYNTIFGATPTQPKAKKLSPRDQEALDWANANPKDPRAIKIKANLGM